MDRQEIRRWLSRNAEGLMSSTPLDDEELDHIAMCMEHLVKWFYEDYPLGDFLTAVIHNDLREACFTADDANRKALYLYALFLYNKMPAEWREKAKQ